MLVYDGILFAFYKEQSEAIPYLSIILSDFRWSGRVW